MSGGPNIDPIGNVASGQSQLGDRPIGSLLIAREKGIPIKVIGTVFQKSPYAVISLAEKPIKTAQELKGQNDCGFDIRCDAGSPHDCRCRAVAR